MAALFSARGGARTLLLEGARRPGAKILVSGGGHCNVLPSKVDASDFHGAGSRALRRRWLRSWPLAEVRAFFETDLGVPLALESGTGKLFPRSGRARSVLDALLQGLQRAGVRPRCESRVTVVARDETSGVEDPRFSVRLADGALISCRRVILATGGRSLPRTGSDGAGHEIARALGHTLVETHPALVPLTSPDRELRELAGLSLPVRWRAVIDGETVEERTRELLFTHRGFSGPAILDASHWSVRSGATIRVAWGGYEPEHWIEEFRAHGRRTCGSVVADFLPRRLARVLAGRCGVPAERTGASLRRDERRAWLEALCAFDLPVDGNLGYRVAEVTSGGVATAEVVPSTLESRLCPRLHLCGEVLDVTGRLGGYNFLWAWISGKLAGEGAARGVRR